MENGSIPDNKITASSTHSNSEVAWGRLHHSQGSWTPDTETGYQWLQVDFEPDVKLITHIATQGNGKNWWWVKEYYVMFKKGQEALKEYMENNHGVVSEGLASLSFLLRRLKRRNFLGILITDLSCSISLILLKAFDRG